MIIFKYMVLLIIFGSSSYVGVLISKKYQNRVYELKEFKEVLNVLENKIRFTYKPLGEIFEDIINLFDKKSGITKIFIYAKEKMKKDDLNSAWKCALNSSKTILSLNEEDINIVHGLGKLLRKNGYGRTS